MTDDINRMLASACEGRPIHASIDDVVRRGRRRVRLRRSGGAAFSMLAVGGVLAAITAWPAGGPLTPERGSDSAATAVSQPGPATIGDDEVIQRCLELNHEFVRWSENKAGGGTDPIDEFVQLAEQVAREFPNAIFFTSKLIFRHENWLIRLLHNQAALTIQRRLHFEGMQMVILPMQLT